MVQLKSHDGQISTIWKGADSLRIFDHPNLELPELRRVHVLAGYRFPCTLTSHDLILQRNLP